MERFTKVGTYHSFYYVIPFLRTVSIIKNFRMNFIDWATLSSSSTLSNMLMICLGGSPDSKVMFEEWRKRIANQPRPLKDSSTSFR